jgi:hypothetical protein
MWRATVTAFATVAYYNIYLLYLVHHSFNDATALQQALTQPVHSSGGSTTSTTAAAPGGTAAAAAASSASNATTAVVAATAASTAANAAVALTDPELFAQLESDSELYGKVCWGTPYNSRSRIGIIADPRFVRKDVQEGAFYWRNQFQSRLLMRLFKAGANGSDLYSFVRPE